MANRPTIYDRWGQPMRRTELKKEVAAATVGGVRSPVAGYPGDGLNPERLAAILRAADQGDPVAKSTSRSKQARTILNTKSTHRSCATGSTVTN